MENNGSLIGVDLGGTNMRVGVVSNNVITEITTRKVNKSGTADDIFDELCEMIASMIQPDTQGIGIGVPSIIDVEKGIVYDVTNIPQWKEIHLKSRLEAIFKVPVYVNNDANCFAAGEKYYGVAKDKKSFVGLIVGTGLGAGIIINNHLYEGRNCGAGEFGCIAYKGYNYEYYCSGQFFVNHFNMSAYEAAQLAIKGDSNAKAMYYEFGTHLGNAIKTVLYAYDPEMIVLGGSVSKSFEFFKEGMYNSLQSFLFRKTIDALQIEVSAVQNIAVYGAAALYYNNKQK